MNLSNSLKNFQQKQQETAAFSTAINNKNTHNKNIANKPQTEFYKNEQQLPILQPLASATGSGKLLIDTYDLEMNKVSGYFTGEPLIKGYFVNKINPSLVDDFSYLNRNKLVNRRMAIKKQMMNSPGLVPIIKHYDNYTKKNEGEFTLANPTNDDVKRNAKTNKQTKTIASHSSIEKYFQPANAHLYHPFGNISNNEDILEEASLRTFKSLPMQLNSIQKPLTNKQITLSQNINSSSDPKINKSSSSLDMMTNSQNNEFNLNMLRINEDHQYNQDKDEQMIKVRREYYHFLNEFY